jgi:hypothetical protein
VDAVVIAAMLCAVGIIVLGVTGGDEEGSDDPSSPAPEVERTPQADESGGGLPGEGSADDERMPTTGDEVDLARAQTFFSAYRIAIPKNWDTTRHSSFVLFACKDRSSDVRVYFERRSGQPEEMEDELRRFIKAEHPGANLGDLERTRVGGADAASLTARYGGSTETATVVSKQPYLYLVVSRWDESASEDERAATTAVLNSFRPA